MPSTYMRCVARFWYHLHSLKNVKNTHGRVLILVKLQAKACNFTKINTPPWKFFIVQMEVLNCTNGTKSRNASRIFNFSFKTGVFPDSLKINKMTLIHKEDSKLII